jgi:hypothetical protein
MIIECMGYGSKLNFSGMVTGELYVRVLTIHRIEMLCKQFCRVKMVFVKNKEKNDAVWTVV